MFGQRLDGPFLVELRRRHAAADVVDAEGGHRLQGGIVIAVLRADLELHFRVRARRNRFRARGSRNLRLHEGLGKGAGGHSTACKPHEFSAIHTLASYQLMSDLLIQ